MIDECLTPRDCDQSEGARRNPFAGSNDSICCFGGLTPYQSIYKFPVKRGWDSEETLEDVRWYSQSDRVILDMTTGRIVTYAQINRILTKVVYHIVGQRFWGRYH